MLRKEKNKFMLEAINMAREGMDTGDGGPFGAVIVKNGKIIGKGNNRVTSSNDPTAHAEIVAIRDACNNLKSFQLEDCEIYTSCEPCPMCLGAIYWARPKAVYYAANKNDAADAGFDDDFIYKEIAIPIADRKIPMIQLLQEKAQLIFTKWKEKTDKIEY
jgi:tRNA(Arg) A34 adenosine deaminase TadA